MSDLDGFPLKKEAEIDGLPLGKEDVDGVPLESTDLDGFPLVKDEDIDGIPLSRPADRSKSKYCFMLRILSFNKLIFF